MIIDDQNNYFFAGSKGLLEVHNQQVIHHLNGDNVSISRIDQHKYLISNCSKKVIQIYNIKDKTVTHTIDSGEFLFIKKVS